MNLAFEQQGAVSVVAISGSVDSLTAEALLSALQQHMDQDHIHLVADFSGVDYVSSAGQVQPSVLKVLDLSGFTTIMKLYDDVPQAVASYD